MSSRIDPREVLEYLNELGYTNIDAQQLKEFIKDLKKVIKYDKRYGQVSQSLPAESITIHQEMNQYEDSEGDDKENSFIPETSQYVEKVSIKSSPPRYTQKDKHIAVHIFENKPKFVEHRHCVHVEETGPKISEKITIATNLESQGTIADSAAKTGSGRARPSSLTSNKGLSKGKKSKVTFIRPQIPKPLINKSDPVALYHYYQSEWKKSKIPGEDSREDLRWAIREKMLGGPKVEVKSKCNIPRCGWSR